MRVTHRGLCVRVAEPVLSDGHRRADLVEQCRVAMAERVEATLRDAEGL